MVIKCNCLFAELVTRIDSILEIAVLIGTPAALIYSWAFYFQKMHPAPSGWRKRVTLATLSLVTLTGLSWLAMLAFLPHADWGTGVGIDHQLAYVEGWHRVIARALVLAMVLSLFGRPRLILPIWLASFGTFYFWIMSTMP